MYDNIGKLKSYRSFRISVEESDKVSLRIFSKLPGNTIPDKVEGTVLRDLSMSGLGIYSSTKLTDKHLLSVSLKFKTSIFACDIKLMRTKIIYNDYGESEKYFYGLEFSVDSREKSQDFLGLYIQNFTKMRLRKLMTELLLNERELNYQSFKSNFHLFLSLMQDMKRFSDFDFFLDCIMKETARYIKTSKYNLYRYTNGNSFLTPTFYNENEKEYVIATKNTFIEKLNSQLSSLNTSYNSDFINNDMLLKRYSSNVQDEVLYVLSIPVLDISGKTIAQLVFTKNELDGKFSNEDEKIATLLGTLISNSFENEQATPVQKAIDESIVEINDSKIDHTSFTHKESFNSIQMKKFISKCSNHDENILISGDTGVGKTYLANLIHKKGQRSMMSMGLIECSEMNNLISLEELLLGTDELIGRFELYSGGTIIFHDLDLLSLTDQKNLFLHIDKFTDIKFIALAVKDLGKLVVEGKFYKKLYESFCDNYFHIEPLINRKEDIVRISEIFLNKYSIKYSQRKKDLSAAVKNILVSYDWPNNIAELDLAIERLIIYNPCIQRITTIDNKVIPIFKSNDTMERYYEKIISKDNDLFHKLDRDIRNDLLSVFIIKKYMSQYPSDSIEDVSKFYNLSVEKTNELLKFYDYYFYEETEVSMIDKEAS